MQEMCGHPEDLGHVELHSHAKIPQVMWKFLVMWVMQKKLSTYSICSNCNGVWEIRGFNQCNYNDFYHWDGKSVAFLCKKNKLFHTNFFGQGSLNPPPLRPNFFWKKVFGRSLTPPSFWTMSKVLKFFFEFFPKLNQVGIWKFVSDSSKGIGVG